MTTYGTLNNYTISSNGSGYNTATVTNPGAASGTISYGAGATVGGISGQYLTVNAGSSTYTTSWANQNHNFVSNNGQPIMTVPTGEQKVVLEKAATLEVKGNVVINGFDLEERLKTIEKLLQIPERDAIMEAKYPSLKKKYDDYINTLEKYRTFERIKGDDDGTT